MKQSPKKYIMSLMLTLALLTLHWQISAAAADDLLYGAAWLEWDEKLYVFGTYNDLTIVSRRDGGEVVVQEMCYRMSGSRISVHELSGGDQAALMQGEMTSDGLVLEGTLLTRLERSTNETAEAPGIVGGWTDGASEQVLLMHSDGSMSATEYGELVFDDGRYLRYGPYLFLTVPIFEEQPIWLYYDSVMDQMTDGHLSVHRIPLEQAIMRGLDRSAAPER